MKNDKSTNIKDWTAKKLKEEYLVLNDLINNPDCACYGTKDLILFDMVSNELARRKIYPKDVNYTLANETIAVLENTNNAIDNLTQYMNQEKLLTDPIAIQYFIKLVNESKQLLILIAKLKETNESEAI